MKFQNRISQQRREITIIRGILRDVVTLWHCARRCRFLGARRKASRKLTAVHANTFTGTYLVSQRPSRGPWQLALQPSSEIPTSLWSRISLC